ncbi:transcriptional regulator [Streptomyces sp. H39-S7]|uniref:transcriptional regulator n=1 Tax=Streptomyces sp. H39-S7 TaxID=3004357 RepID=UPI0022AF5F47|nr:transcriptional regulator [Streptomyces sp. H39-S7]MCZ4125432.1 transcriptional regulator [Streptomyces sp. H39-S7]
MDRRAFLIATGATLTGAADQWLTSPGQTPPTTASTDRVQVTSSTVDHLDQRLDHLRHLDDSWGGGTLRTLASAELEHIESLLNDGRYTTAVGQRLQSAAAENARLCGWLAFDSGDHAAGQRYYLTALRAAREADDRATGANTLAFMAIQTYSIGNPADAITLVDTAQTALGRNATPRVQAMLHARIARAYAKAGRPRECAHAMTAAYDAYAKGPHDDDPAWCYWLTTGELENLAGSSALDLGDWARALARFDGALAAAYGNDGYQRDHALYLTRAAEAHLAQRDIEQACASAEQAVTLLGGVTSARSSSTLSTFRSKLDPYRDTPAARDFLASLAS